MASCPPSACEADLGPAPPPGSSRLITRAAILSALSAAGENPGPHAQVSPVRVTSAARSLSAQELGQLVRPVVERCVPASATLSGVEPKSGVVLPLSATAQSCSLAPLPKRAGPVASTALVDFVHDGVLVRRVPVLVRLVLSAEAARPDVPKGHVVTLVIERRTATVSTQGIALSDAEVGELAAFKVQRTGRVVNARVQSSGLARVVDAQ